MKIGILSYHRANNVGAVLQNYALQQCILQTNNMVETIDYRCAKIEKENRIYQISGVKEFVKRCLCLTQFVSREKKFKKFRDQFIILSHYHYNETNIADCNEIYDIFITGSDQVWNYNLNDNDQNFLLNFVDDKKKKNSYGASFGFVNIDMKKKENIINKLSSFSNILVREKEAQDMLSENGLSSEVVLDPTLLVGSLVWNKLLLDENLKNEKFILVYLVANTPDLFNQAIKYAKEKNMKVYCMHYNYKKFKDCINLQSISPQEFLSYIKYANKIFCSSFHAVCFSIIFEKDFVCGLDQSKQNNNSRITSLCNHLDLNDRILGKNTSMDSHINYDLVNEKLEYYVERSLKLLDAVLKEKEQ